MQDRNAKLNQQFIDAVTHAILPRSDISLSLAESELTKTDLIDLFESQIMSRHLDLRSRLMQKEGNSFYTIGSAGHEGNAAVAKALRSTDMAFLHYRSGAFVVQRSKQVEGQTPLYDMLLSFAASSDDPCSGGRHKVLGSKSLFIPPQTSTIASHLPKAVGTAFSITLSKKLETEALLPKDGIVLCNFGDASANHSTAQGAINAAAWAAYQSVPLPIVFLCEDNGIGISTSTPEGWIESNFRHRPGLEYIQCDGLNLYDTYQKTRLAAHIARKRRKPVFLHMRTVRLLGHAGSDAEFVYRSEKRILEAEAQDPLLHGARLILEANALSQVEIIDLYRSIEARIARISREASGRPRLRSAEAVKRSIVPNKSNQINQEVVSEQRRKTLFAHDAHNLSKKQHMAKLINWALIDEMAKSDSIVLFGEDVGKKGGVYNVTTKLFDRFGPNRVINTLLDEQSILGLAIGLAHNGFLPIPEIQFLAYVHNAEDQIRGEAATLPFFSNGQFTNPMVIRIAGLAYQKGFGGHFHNDNSFAVFRDIPGVIIACPSNGADAVAMLRRCIRLAKEEQRVVIFIEPIALYMKKDLHDEGDNLWAFDYVPPSEETPMMLGELGVHGSGKDVCIVTYGNGVYLSRQAQHKLQQQGINVKVVDLRWLAPLNEDGIITETKGFKQVLIVDECRKTASISEAIVTVLIENTVTKTQPNIQRITADDCFIPLGSASFEVLPKTDEIVQRVMSMVKRESNLKSVV
ncbi:thiamine pyrophosphate-dependent enzyme [Aestuariibacter sp. AA17]|uniref:3-methyl-2-oxobutanoate dehydrogenase (2-methylpropanoyl-transferring) n=1 Tax=Fluctibacter corallii TaxID=2984329 RepID=A0ABT3AD37_9ALTE|nr:thiamine pyrophosphate-dependent enzyme [Aestuariibacter sp. AA17]MCV2886587.1 thiamine pyrophosphate-dependent enzyme [Aestuariibacter sp. AA17]